MVPPLVSTLPAPQSHFQVTRKSCICSPLKRLLSTRRERPSSAPYLRLKIIQGTTIGNIGKNYFFSKVLVKKVEQCRKPQKEVI